MAYGQESRSPQPVQSRLSLLIAELVEEHGLQSGPGLMGVFERRLTEPLDVDEEVLNG